MGTVVSDRIDKCANCGLPLPLRRARPGEAASNWKCSFCNARLYGVLLDECPPDVLENVRPDADLDPRMIVGGRTLAAMYKRSGRTGRVFDERRSDRKPVGFALTVLAGDGEVRVKTLDLSAGGFGFVSDRPLEPGELITARFHSLPGAPETRGVVRSCVKFGEDQYRIGAQFMPQTDDAAESAGT